MRQAARWIAAGILLAATWLAFRIGIADVYARRATAEGLAEAVRLQPGDADYHRWLGVALLARDPGRAEQEFAEAVRLNHWDADSRMRLALMHESQGKVAEAEQELLETTKWDATFLPRWALANFEYRHEKMAEFWVWAQKSVGMSYGDRRPLFELAAATGETNLAQRLGLQKDDVWLAYLQWGLGKAPVEEIRLAAVHVANAKNPEKGALAAACDRLLDLGAVEGALEVWNAAVKTGAITAGEAARGRVTNGRFAVAPSGAGFDWVVERPVGGYVAAAGPGGGLRIHFNGEQCEQCTVLTQRVAVSPGARYRVKVKYKTVEVNRKSGLRWVVGWAKGSLAGMKDGLWAEDGGAAEVDFQAPAGVEWVRLSLVHQRPEGETRTEGTILVEGVEMERGNAVGTGSIARTG